MRITRPATVLSVFFEVVLPVALIAVAGGAVGRWRAIPVAPLSTLVFYLLSPSLVFNSLANTELSAGESARIVGVLLATFAVMYVCAAAWSGVRRHGRALRAAFALGATTPNLGNMGIPVAQLAFGDEGAQIAVMTFVVGAVLSYTAGIAIASMATGTTLDAFRAPFRYPTVYAAALGVLVNALNVDLPVAVDEPVRTLAGGAIPCMLVVLGLQLQHAGSREHLTDAIAVNLGRLLIAPAVAFAVASLMGLGGETRDTLVVLASMPTAVIATILATEFRAEPGFVTRIVVTSTLASMLTLTVLIALLR